VNDTDERERLERVEELLLDLRDENDDVPILVEGSKDRETLRTLGFTGDLIQVHRGESIFNFCEELARDHEEVIVLMDWDRTGGQLTELLEEGLEANQVAYDFTYRRELARATRKEISDVEALDTYIRNLRRLLGLPLGGPLRRGR
jgi:5S rRNA maturation endonuclease (ribonuclease M5)